MGAPIDKITFGNVTLAVFENTVGKGKESFTTKSVVIQKNYKDKDGKWKSTSSFKPSELMYVIMACQDMLERIYRKDDIETVDFSEAE
jgi:hypothetical protein